MKENLIPIFTKKMKKLEMNIILFFLSVIIIQNIYSIYINGIDDTFVTYLYVYGIVVSICIYILFFLKSSHKFIKNTFIIALGLIYTPLVFIIGDGFFGYVHYLIVIICLLQVIFFHNDINKILRISMVLLNYFALLYKYAIQAEEFDKIKSASVFGFMFIFLIIIIVISIYSGINNNLLNHLNSIAHTDELTKICNRRYVINNVLFKKEEQVIKNNEWFSCAIIDIDDFKKINDSYGHKYGDKVLIILSECLQAFFEEENALIGRFAGDEFVIFLDNVGIIEASEKLEKMRVLVSNLEFGNGIKTSVSCGVVTVNSDNTSGYLRKADLSLFEAKSLGKNRVVSYELNYTGKK